MENFNKHNEKWVLDLLRNNHLITVDGELVYGKGDDYIRNLVEKKNYDGSYEVNTKNDVKGTSSWVNLGKDFDPTQYPGYASKTSSGDYWFTPVELGTYSEKGVWYLVQGSNGPCWWPYAQMSPCFFQHRNLKGQRVEATLEQYEEELGEMEERLKYDTSGYASRIRHHYEIRKEEYRQFFKVFCRNNTPLNLIETHLHIVDDYSCPEPRGEYYLYEIQGQICFALEIIETAEDFCYTKVDNTVVAYLNDESLLDEKIAQILEGEWVTLPVVQPEEE